jgi:hypothetical protein
LGRVQVVGVQQDEGAAGPGLPRWVEPADLAVATGVADAGVVIAVVVELPAERRAVERLGRREVMGVDLDVADRVVDFGHVSDFRCDYNSGTDSLVAR